jgi:hypothetical protein
MKRMSSQYSSHLLLHLLSNKICLTRKKRRKRSLRCKPRLFCRLHLRPQQLPSKKPLKKMMMVSLSPSTKSPLVPPK